ncbi:envelope biogenesis factor ElyC [Vibrio sp.]|nr:envelope biogenesis factor ElyC [Vibrio sp.]
MFELKKLLSALLMPLPFFLLLGIASLLLIMFTRHHKTGCFGALFAFIGIFFISFQPMSSSLLFPLERQHKGFSFTEQTVDYVVVLGNGHIVDSDIPPTSELTRNGLMRLNEGIRIHRLYPGSKLILSGYNGGTTQSNARMMAKVALALGVKKSDIVLLESAKDTWEEARQTAAFIKGSHLVLVTSASHMERALNEFHSVGLKPIPAPTNFLAHKDIQQAWTKYTPQAKYLEQTERYWHETLGIIWQRIRNMASSD